MMDRQKKKELAEMDSRWDFEKKVRTVYEDDWEAVRHTFNWIQQNQGDLYMTVSKFRKPTTLEKLKIKYRSLKSDKLQNEVTFHHRQIYEWFESLANHLDISIGQAVYMVEYETKELREELGLGDTVNVEMKSITDLEKDSKVSKDELEKMIEDE